MGVVVAATHLDLEQKVALKFLLPSSLSDPALVERFLREARASVRLRSPHVARTLDTGRLEGGSPFIVMEFLEGRDLSAELDARAAALSLEDAATYVLHACDALAEAHAAGIVHRDLKPANLFLSRGHDGRAHIKVLDFGISKVLHATDGGGRQGALTTTDAVFGSPAYMSPEQMRASKDVDARTDIWSIGVVLYELLTRRLPFEASTALELGLKASQDEPLRPTALRPDLPHALERVVLRCLEKEPSKRFQDVGELAAALAPFAHPRDRAIADRIFDIARAGARGGGEARVVHDVTPPAESSDRLHLALDRTQLAVATEKEKRREPRVGRPLVLVGVVTLGVGAPERSPRRSRTWPARPPPQQTLRSRRLPSPRRPPSSPELCRRARTRACP